MFILLLILFIIECGAFCYLFYKSLEIEKDIEILYKNYSNYIEDSFNKNKGVILK